MKKSTLLLYIVIVILLLFLGAAAEKNTNTYQPANDGVAFFDDFSFGMSEQELTEKIPFELDKAFIYSENKKALRYMFPCQEPYSEIRIEFSFYRDMLTDVYVYSKLSVNESKMGYYYSQTNETISKQYGDPNVSVTQDYEIALMAGKATTESERFDYIWDLPNEYRIIHEATSEYSPLVDNISIHYMGVRKYEDLDPSALFIEGGEGYLIPPRGESFLFGITYGMSKDEVSELEPGIMQQEAPNSINGLRYKHSNLLGYSDVFIEYGFLKDELYNVLIIFDMKDLERAVDEYFNINRYLITAYGTPTVDDESWDDMDKIDFDRTKYAEGIKNKDLTIMWAKDSYDQNVIHSIKGDGWIFTNEPIHFLEFTMPRKIQSFSETNLLRGTTISTSMNIHSLSIGEYDVGIHIPVGEYKVTPVKSAGISVYRNGSLKINEYLSATDQDEIGRLVLQDGDRIEITGGKLSFEPYK